MYKKCEEILKKLEREGKIKISDYQFPPKQELKLRLKDMLEDEVDEKYYLSDEMVNKIRTSNFMQERKKIQEKEYCDTLRARDWKDPKCVRVATLPYFGYESDGRVYSPSGISPCLRAKEPNQKIDERDSILIKNATKKGYLEATDGDSVNLAYPESETRRGRVGNQVSQTLQCNDSMGVVENLRIRKLTPKECWRLMGFDDEDYEKAAQVNSNTQCYKQAGNSICVPVLEAILKELIK